MALPAGLDLETLKDNPYGTTVFADDVVESLGFFDDWEARYRYILDLGRELPTMPESLQTEDRLLRGCQSQVWIDHALADGKLWFAVDADAHIVRGLIAVVLAALNGRSPQDVLAVDVEKYFAGIDLLKHLSPTRGNGLRALVAKIRAIAAASG